MYYAENEREPFEGFGEADADEALISDFGPDFDTELEEAALAAATEENSPEAPHVEHQLAKAKAGFSWAGLTGGLAALVWIAGALGGPLSYYGPEAVMAMDPALQAGLIALAFGPALLFWVSASAAGEALKARTLVAELARLAQDARTPFEAGASDAQRMGASVRTEIEALNDAVAAAIDRLAELEMSAQRNAIIFSEAVDASHENAELMSHALKRERDEMVELNGELRGQSQAVAQSIGRQARLMREASKLVKTEVSAAEEALQSHLASFAASASVIGERTSAFHRAADEAAAVSTSLNGAMANMLEGLTEATRLSDSARNSSEQAVIAANETAGALRDTTRSAVTEAKRAAQFIRAETQAMQEGAADTLAKLKEAAHAARAASEESQAAADRHAASIEKRLSALAATAAAKRAATPTPRPTPTIAREPAVQRPPARESAVVQPDISDLRAAASAAIARSTARAESEPRRVFKGFGSWGNFLPQTRAEAAPKPANDDQDLVAFSRERKHPDLKLKGNALDLVTEAGVDLDDVLGPSDLDRIARSSRNGAAARRAAVVDAAPGAVTRIARYVRRNNKAHLVANEFRTRPDLAKSEDKSEGSDLVRAYLLIDAALA